MALNRTMVVSCLVNLWQDNEQSWRPLIEPISDATSAEEIFALLADHYGDTMNPDRLRTVAEQIFREAS